MKSTKGYEEGPIAYCGFACLFAAMLALFRGESVMSIYGNRRLVVLVVIALGVVGGCAEKPVVKGPIPPGDYVVAEQDDLSSISLRAYGDMKFWYGLLNANPALAKRPGFDLVVGETIEVPARADLDMKLPKSVFPKVLPADYIVMPGDSLHFIAKGCYGDRELWMVIYEANRDRLSEAVKQDTRRLIAGQVLHIPEKEAKGAKGGQAHFAPKTAQNEPVPAGQVLHIPAKPSKEQGAGEK